MQQSPRSERVPSCAPGGLADYGVGVDTERVARWRELLPSLRARSHARLFTEQEHCYCQGFADPAPVYAGHWCAKEAVFKAVSSLEAALLEAALPEARALTIDQIEIGHRASGCPVARLPSWLASLVRVRVSISHDVEQALAFAVALRPDARAETMDAWIEGESCMIEGQRRPSARISGQS
ncbi:MAG: hypothetical protein RL033_5190 [Pseudomonadota bacterium]|jgi:phosphopantetheine--protein transferase-like protein